MGLVLAAMIGSIDAGLALAKDDKGMRKNDKGRYEQRGRDYRPYGDYGHRERVYYPPRGLSMHRLRRRHQYLFFHPSLFAP